MGAAVSDHVSVPRSELRSLSWGVAGIVVGMAMLATALGVKVFSDRDRCEAGNEFRRDLRTAFAEYTSGAGREFGGDPDQVDGFAVTFDDRLVELFPSRDCPLLG